MKSGAFNETLIIDNFGQVKSDLEISDHTFAGYSSDGGRTYIKDSTLTRMDKLKIVRNAHVAVHPDLTK